VRRRANGWARCHSRTMTATLAAICLLAVGATLAYAYVYTDIIDFNLTESTTTYGQYGVSSGTDGWVSYRWVDDPNHTTVISGNNCSDLSLYGKAEIPAHNTSYFALFHGFGGLCFALRGRVAAGAGSMVNHDGRLQR
jgi:hypothetical protein